MNTSKERQEKKAEQKEYENKQDHKLRSLHPAWYVVAGVLLAGLAILIWTFFIYPRYVAPV